MKYRGFQLSWWLIFTELCLIGSGSLFGSYLLEALNVRTDVLELLFQLLTIIPILLGFILLKKYFPFSSLGWSVGFRSFDVTMLLFFIVMPFMAQYFASYAMLPANYVLSVIFGEYDPGIGSPENLSQFIVLLVSGCIIAPVLEEILFRGIIMRLLEPYGFLTAALVSSVGFAILHLNPAGFLVIMFLGFILASIRYISGSVLACMVFHAFSNFYSVIDLALEDELIKYGEPFAIFSVISALLFPAVLLLYKKLYPAQEKYISTRKSLGFSTGLLLCIAAFCAYLAVLIIYGG